MCTAKAESPCVILKVTAENTERRVYRNKKKVNAA
jgi:hypothetical protein